MSKIKGIYAASMSVFNSDLSLNIEKTVNHAEKIIDIGCHGVAIFGSTGQAQLIPISEKIALLNELSKSKYREKYLIGTGLNSLNETINLMKVATFIKFIVSFNELSPVPIKYFSLYLLFDNSFNRAIFSLMGMSCACPVLPKIATPWQPISIIFSAWLTVFSIFRLKSLLNTDIDAA